MEVEYRKVLRRNDIQDRLVVPKRWIRKFPPGFRNGENEARIRALWLGFYWEFRCAIRAGQGERATLQAEEWKKFILFGGIPEGDMLILQEEENHERGTNYNIRVQRKDADGRWDDVPPPARDAPTFHQFNI